MKLIKRFFMNKQTYANSDVVVYRPPVIPKSVMEAFGWDETTPLKMSYVDKYTNKIVIEKEEK